ncbi:MAG: hypothetical protein Ta2A_19830 [Treponemataceae bacterium]|nr:MAG: hypothetical protein Ta2A_19830 [Treponemataceae bacterium]
MKKIDVSKFDHFVFRDSAHAVYAAMPQLYKSGNYTEYIKFQCLGSFFFDL